MLRLDEGAPNALDGGGGARVDGAALRTRDARAGEHAHRGSPWRWHARWATAQGANGRFAVRPERDARSGAYVTGATAQASGPDRAPGRIAAGAAGPAGPSHAQPHASRVAVSDAGRHRRDGDAGSLPPSLAINGKFTSQRMTGVQRVAQEYAAAFARVLPAQGAPVVLVPSVYCPDALPAAARRRVVPRFRGVLWEQLALPMATRGHTLLSLCNIGPLFKRKQVVMIHDAAVFDLPDGYSKKFRLWYRFAFAMLKLNARHFLTVSQFSKDRIVARLKIAPERISVIRSGVDHLGKVDSDDAILKKLNLSYDRFALIVGSLAPNKNLARVIEAIERLERDHDFTFVIAGGQNLKIFGSTVRKDRSDAKRVVWAGYVSDGELKALYENAACFVFPSLYEGFGLPPLEAMYCGCPVIASREASLPELCGDAAVYCDAHSVDDIADKIAALMTDVELRRSLRERGRTHAQAYRWDDAAAEMIRVLREVS
jgi:glycosyltransferase involved in cell wall biosynthesis